MSILHTAPAIALLVARPPKLTCAKTSWKQNLAQERFLLDSVAGVDFKYDRAINIFVLPRFVRWSSHRISEKIQ